MAGVFVPAHTAELMRMYYLTIAKQSHAPQNIIDFFSLQANWDSPDGENTINTINALAGHIGVSPSAMHVFPIAGYPYPPLVRDNSSCMYTMEFDNTQAPKYPLLDRIKPTATISDLRTQDNYAAKQTLLDNEHNRYTTGSYYAGEISFLFHLTDSGSSQYSGNPIDTWRDYAGVSGVKSATVDIVRIEDHLGNILPAPELVYSGSLTMEYDENMERRTNESLDGVPDIHSFRWTGEIRKTGLYQIILQMSDHAGNKLNNNDRNIAYFTVVPAMILPDNPGEVPSDCDPLVEYCDPPRVPVCHDEICIPTKPIGEVREIQGICEITPTDPRCVRDDLGVVSITHPTHHELYADANVVYDTILTFFDRFYNVIDGKDLLTITQTGVTIALDSVTPGEARAIVTQVNNTGTTSEDFLSYPTM